MTAATLERPRTPEILVPRRWMPAELEARMRLWSPKTGLGHAIRDLIQTGQGLIPEQVDAVLAALGRVVVLESALYGTVFRSDGRVERLGLLSRKVITTTGVGYLVDAWQNSVEMEDMKYHGFGSSSAGLYPGEKSYMGRWRITLMALQKAPTQYSPMMTPCTKGMNL